MGPLTPQDPIAMQRLPEGVFEAFNDEIRLTLKNGVAVVAHRDVVLRIMKIMDCTEETVEEMDWVFLAKEAYEEAGWTVVRTHHPLVYTFHRVAPAPPPKPPELTSRQRYEQFMRRRGGGGSL